MKGSPSVKIGLIGDCAVPALGVALKHLVPQADVVALKAIDVSTSGRFEEAAHALERCDLFFARGLSEKYGLFGSDRIRDRFPNVRRLPRLLFTGFHPDCVYLDHARGSVHCPVGYNSAIAAAAFALGLDVADTLGLYDTEVYRQLGYLDEFAKAYAFLDREFEACGLDMGEIFPSWMDRAPFMYTINHPRPHVIASLAFVLARREGLIDAGHRPPELLYDDLSRYTIWPVYPEVGDAIGIGGSYQFQRGISAPDAPTGPDQLVDLHGLVTGSFGVYERVDREVFRADTIAHVRKTLAALVGVTDRSPTSGDETAQ